MFQLPLEIDLKKFVPHTIHGKPGNKEKVKKEYRDAIIGYVGRENIDEVRDKIAGKELTLDVLFRLKEPPSNETKTNDIKDLDNLLKPLLDALSGVKLIDDDNDVFEIHVEKEIVKSSEEEGVHIVIEEHQK